MKLILELPSNKGVVLQSKAEAEGVTAEQYVQRILDRDLELTLQAGTDDRPIWEVIQDIMKDVPDEVFDRLPKDGASQVDHYLYGHPKRD